MTLELHLRLAGALILALAALHGIFPRRFAWKEELPRLSLLNHQIFIAHTLFLVLVLAMIGALALFFPATLIEPSLLARLVLFGITLFWFLRLLAQFFLYSPALWRGDRFRTAVHVLFSLFWVYCTGVFGWSLVAQLSVTSP